MRKAEALCHISALANILIDVAVFPPVYIKLLFSLLYFLFKKCNRAFLTGERKLYEYASNNDKLTYINLAYTNDYLWGYIAKRIHNRPVLWPETSKFIDKTFDDDFLTIQITNGPEVPALCEATIDKLPCSNNDVQQQTTSSYQRLLKRLSKNIQIPTKNIF